MEGWREFAREEGRRGVVGGVWASIDGEGVRVLSVKFVRESGRGRRRVAAVASGWPRVGGRLEGWPD